MACEANKVAPKDNERHEKEGLSYLMQDRMKVRPKLLSPSTGKSECCIFRVPPHLIKINGEAYYPIGVSIGPYHHGEEHLQTLEEYKWRFLSSLLTRCEPHGVHLQQLIDAVLPDEDRIRESYWECINKFSRNELVMMMVLDGCFIIELLAMHGGLVPGDQSIYKVTWIFPTVLRDFYRLENQIPYFVLEKLFQITTAFLPAAANISLALLALNFFNFMEKRPSHILDDCINPINNNQAAPVRHLLDLYWRSFTLPDENHTHVQNRSKELSIESTQMLRQAGIKFRKKEATNSFLDISFNNGTLDIPFVTIDDHHKSLILNFIAFEQCYGHHRQKITSYAQFMNCLINNTADSEYLQSKQIIENFVGTHEEVKRFYNEINKNVFFVTDHFYLATVFEDINKYCSNRWRVGWAGIAYKYFGAPWAAIAASGALIGLCFTFIQTLFTVLSYDPSKSK